jgi:hypothetical protein
MNAWKFVMITEEETEPEDAYDESIKILAEDLVKRARKEGHTITLKQQPETD